ncbi:MAG: BlaI/MecI/CopY family transcriptional regulator [candidate division Zixibacteria bacterium]|nr:BlaI/MecI/CopY family transcriptional regulator [candidate division Zixibacteria bacterium]
MSLPIPLPTDAELELLRMLWTHGPSTVREIHERINRLKPTGYTTVLKLLQIMAEKGLVFRDETHRAHLYHVQHPEADTQTRLVDQLLDRAFGGSAEKLVLRALSSKPASAEELRRIRAILDRMEGEER